MICNLVCIADATSLHTSTQMGKNGQSALNICPFWHYFVCCKNYLHPQRNITHPM